MWAWIIQASCEVYLQHYTIANNLSKVIDDLFQAISEYTEEKNDCVIALGVDSETSKQLINHSRNSAILNTKVLGL